jgi:ribokinase
MRIVLNAAPARPLVRELLTMVTTLIVNESEAAALAPLFGWPAEAGAFAAAGAAAIDGLEVVVTRGAAGAISVLGHDRIHVPAPTVEVIDTTGAGDAFVGAFAAALDAGDDRPRRAIAIAAGSSRARCTARSRAAGTRCNRRVVTFGYIATRARC